MTLISPFTSTRYEYAGRDLFFVPDDLRRQLERSVPLFILGSRGTGKTTLLRYLNWRERVRNDELRSQLDDRPFHSGVVGVYFRLSDVDLSLFERWLQNEDDETYGLLFSTYLELNWLELMFDAILGLVKAEVIAPTLSAEQEVAEEIAEELYPGAESASLTQCTKLARALRRQFRQFYLLKKEPAEALATGWAGQGVGALIRKLSPLLIHLCEDFCQEEGSVDDWSFRLCLDEAEALSDRQQLTLNTIVRTSEWPTFPVAAYVTRPSVDQETLIPDIGIQRADLEYVSRDEVTNKEFEALADGVARLRIARGLRQAKLSQDLAAEYTVRNHLGSLNINLLLERILSRSESEFASTLLEQARLRLPDNAAEAAPPIYETYLLERLGLSIPETRRRRRHVSSVTVRKKMVAAYLTICAQIGARPEYASADVTLQTSDKCIRDFLWQMDAIFECADLSLQAFAKANPIAMDIQVPALRRASERKLARLPKLIEVAPSEAQSLVEGLGELTAVIQRSDPNERHLSSPERGAFVVDLDEDDNIGRALGAIVEDAAEWGFLKLIESDRSRLQFRVHTSLAARFGFSYRGSYYDYPLLQKDIENLARTPDERERKRLVRQIVQRTSRLDADGSWQSELGLDV